MKYNKGDLFQWSNGKYFEITGIWGDNEYRGFSYDKNGRPSCGANGQHNTAVNVDEAIKQGSLKQVAILPKKKALIKTFNFGNYYGERLIID